MLPIRVVTVAAALTLTLGACGGSPSAGPTGNEPLQVAASFYPLQWVSSQVAASFYPLQWVTAQVAGEHAEVSSLTPPGAEPHDLELGPRQVATIGEADLVVYLDGFQPAVDEAVAQEAGDSALDVTDPADLVETGGTVDPHFWLDPARLAVVADAVAQRLGEVDPAHSAAFTERAAEVRARLEALDAELAEGLAGCAGTDLVTSHTAFGYLAARYGMEQVGITGLSPESEPSPKALAEVADFVADNDVKTIYSETLVSPEVARTLARETGVETAVLDPLEGLSSESSGEDYLAVMRANLAVLQEGQPCR